MTTFDVVEWTPFPLHRKGALCPKSPGGGPDPKTNRLLATFELEDYDALLADAQIISLKFHKELHKQDQQVDAVYFPLTAMVSLIVATDGKPQMEMAMIGKEGVIGASEILQVQGSMGMTLVQLGGTALRVKAASFQKLITTRPLMQKLVNQHLYALMRQILYGAA